MVLKIAHQGVRTAALPPSGDDPAHRIPPERIRMGPCRASICFSFPISLIGSWLVGRRAMPLAMMATVRLEETARENSNSADRV